MNQLEKEKIVWTFVDYNMLPEHGPLNRHFNLSNHLKKKGYNPVVFVGSHPHNTHLQLITDHSKFKEYQETPFPWVLVKTLDYSNSKIKRVLSMFLYYKNAKIAAKKYGKPMAIIGSSAHPLCAVLAIKLAKKYHCKSIVEIRDLWPESFVEYGIAKENSLIVRLVRMLEKWMYTMADEVIFTAEGGYDYILEQGWENTLPRDKFHYINNGIDVNLFAHNKKMYQISDKDLEDANSFNVVYAGSIKKVNNLGLLLDVAKVIPDSNIKFLIWGDGDELEILKEKAKVENITNVIFKGSVEKKYVPYIISRADLNIAHNNPSKIFRFGISFNKIFDYFAAGRPVLADFECKYNPIIQEKAGSEVCCPTPVNIAQEILRYKNLSKSEYDRYCKNALMAAMRYDFSNLADILIEIIER